MPGGTPLEQFTTLMASQGPAWASGHEEIVNEAVLRSYTIARIQNGKNMMEYVQGGDEITDTIFFEEVSTWQRYNPNVTITRQNPQTGTTWTVPWSFGTAHMSWTKQEIGPNKDTTTRSYRSQRYKAVMYQKHQNLKTDICNAWDAELWAVPDETNMESTTPSGPRVPYSLPVFITEETDGIPLGDGSTAWAGGNVQRIGVVANPKWNNQRGTYTYHATTDNDSIFPAMSSLLRLLKFDRLPKDPQYSDKTTSRHVILCSNNGMTNYEHALRKNQDEFRGIGKTSGQDPDYNNPTFRNVPLDYIEALDTVAIYDDTAGTALADETAAANTGPRYWFINGQYLNFVVHSENYLVLEDPIRPSGQPFTRVQDVDCWNNVICRSRRRQGILSPSADTTNA